MQNSNQNQAENDGKPKTAAFKQVNADDNPIDEHGKTKRDYEVEKAQAAPLPVGESTTEPTRVYDTSEAQLADEQKSKDDDDTAMGSGAR